MVFGEIWPLPTGTKSEVSSSDIFRCRAAEAKARPKGATAATATAACSGGLMVAVEVDDDLGDNGAPTNQALTRETREEAVDVDLVSHDAAGRGLACVS